MALTIAIAICRIGMGFIFMWPFLDKTFGLGFATASSNSWLQGGHPTRGFLSGVDGVFAWLFNPMADSLVVEFLFMLGLFAIGLSLLLGAGVRIGCYAGMAMLLMMWLAALPYSATTADARGATNPFWDSHLMYAALLFWLSLVSAGQHFGIGRWWSERTIVQKYPVLE